MAKLKIVVRKNKVNKDGETKVQISLSHNRETAYISTDITCKVTEYADGRIIGGKGANAKNAKLTAILNEYQQRLEEIPNIRALSVQQIKERICDVPDRFVGLLEAYKSYYDRCEANSTKKAVLLSSRSIENYLQGKDITLDSIDAKFIDGFRKYLDSYVVPRVKRRYSLATINLIIRYLRIVINYSIDNGMVQYKVNPVPLIKITKELPRQNSIDVDEFIRIRDYVDRSEKMNVARDLFLLSFYLGGINLADLVRLDYSGDTISYKRKKIERVTRGQYDVVLPIVPEARTIIDKYIGADGLLNLDKYTRYKLHDDLEKHIHSLYAMVNDRLLCKLKEQGICSDSTTFYSARKCFAQIGMNIGIGDNVINYILGHTPTDRGIIQYYSSVSRDLADVALRMVVDFTNHPEDIKELYKRNLMKRLYQ